MKAEPATERLTFCLSARLKRALTFLFESDPEPYRSLSEFLAALLERIVRERAPQFFAVVPDGVER